MTEIATYAILGALTKSLNIAQKTTLTIISVMYMLLIVAFLTLPVPNGAASKYRKQS